MTLPAFSIARPIARGIAHPIAAHEGVGGWNPTALGASLLAWWSADRADLLTLVGSAVSSWKDIVAGYDAVQGLSAARPVYSATSFNGAPGVTYDATDDQLVLTPSPFPSGASPSEMWGLVQQDLPSGTAGGKNFFSYGSGASLGTRRAQRAVVSGVNRLSAVAGSGTTALAANNLSDDFSGRHVARVIFTATGETSEINGLAGSTTAIVPATGSTRAVLGAGDGNNEYWGGVLRDIIVTAPLTAPQATQLLTYLTAKRMP